MKKVFTVLAIAATLMFAFVSCSKDDDNKKENNEKTDDPKDDPKDEEKGLKITIDGDFADWAALDTDLFVSAKNNPNSPWEGVAEIRCCADPDFVYYYIKYNKETVEELLALNDELPIRLNINTDGEFESGYQSYSLQGYDFILEGGLGNGEGGWGDFQATMYQRLDGWEELAPATSGMTKGAGKGSEYEIMVARELFNAAAAGSTVPMPMGDVFQTGVRFYETTVARPGHWEELSNMPNSSIDVVDNGWGNLLTVATVK